MFRSLRGSITQVLAIWLDPMMERMEREGVGRWEEPKPYVYLPMKSMASLNQELMSALWLSSTGMLLYW